MRVRVCACACVYVCMCVCVYVRVRGDSNLGWVPSGFKVDPVVAAGGGCVRVATNCRSECMVYGVSDVSGGVWCMVGVYGGSVWC